MMRPFVRFLLASLARAAHPLRPRHGEALHRREPCDDRVGRTVRVVVRTQIVHVRLGAALRRWAARGRRYALVRAESLPAIGRIREHVVPAASRRVGAAVVPRDPHLAVRRHRDHRRHAMVGDAERGTGRVVVDAQWARPRAALVGGLRKPDVGLPAPRIVPGGVHVVAVRARRRGVGDDDRQREGPGELARRSGQMCGPKSNTCSGGLNVFAPSVERRTNIGSLLLRGSPSGFQYW